MTPKIHEKAVKNGEKVSEKVTHQKKRLLAMYTFEIHAKPNPVTTELTQVKPPHPH